MRAFRTFTFTSLFLLAVAAIAAPDPAALTDLKTKLRTVSAHKAGEDGAAMQEVETLIVRIANSAGGAEAMEPLLLKTLASAESRQAKVFLCKQLYFVGGEASIPALSDLLTDPDLSHGARRVLERMGTLAADRAILAALPKTSGRTRIGITSTLGSRRMQSAVPALAALLGDGDQATVRAAAVALGRIGTVQSVAALREGKGSGTAAQDIRLDLSLVEAADQLVKAGQTDLAREIYTSAFQAGKPAHVRLGGLRGLVELQADGIESLLVRVLHDDDPQVRLGAVGLLAMVPGTEMTQAVADALPQFDDTMKRRLVGALAERDDASAVPGLTQALSDPSEPLRCAVLRALGAVGGASEVELLLGHCLKGGDAESRAAREALAEIDGEGVVQALVARVGAGTPESRREAVAALAGRADGNAAEVVLEAAQSADKALRLAGLEALASLGGPDAVPVLVAMLTNPTFADDAPVLGKTLAAVLGRVDDPAARATLLTGAYPKAGPEAKCVLLGLLKQTPTVDALTCVRSAVTDADDTVHNAAFRVLCDWTDVAAAPDLIALAEKADGTVEHVLALRGYVRLAGENRNPVPMYGKVMQTARRPEEKRLVLSALSTRSDVAALDLAESFLTAEGLVHEASVATLAIGERLLGSDLDRAQEAGRKVMAVALDEDLKKRAESLAKGEATAEGKPLGKDGFVTEWLGSGPFRKDGVTGLAPHDVPFVPQSATPTDAEWKHLTKGIDGGRIDLIQALGPGGDCAAYVHTRIWSPEDQDAQFELGYDDSGLVWLNGKVVHSKKRKGPAKPGAVKVTAPVNEGWNELMMKVSDMSGRWEFYCAVRKPGGGDLPGVEVAVAQQLNGKPVIAPVSMQKAQSVSTTAEEPARPRRRRPQKSATPEPASDVKIAAAVPMKARTAPLKPRKILVLSYQSHDPGRAAGKQALKLMAERTKAFELTFVEDAKELPKVVMPDYLAQFDAVCVNNSTGGAGKAENGKEMTENLDAYVRSGGGLIGLHAATDNRFGEVIGGFFTGHPWNIDVGVKLDDPAHPLLKAFDGKGFRVTDEIYQFAKGTYTRDNLRVLLSLDVKQTDMNRNGIKREDNDFAVAWVKTHGKGRVFYGSLGHRMEIFHRPDIMQFYLDGIQFALGDLPADATPSAALDPVPTPAPAPPAPGK